jgi:hypothetical protein
MTELALVDCRGKPFLLSERVTRNRLTILSTFRGSW